MSNVKLLTVENCLENLAHCDSWEQNEAKTKIFACEA